MRITCGECSADFILPPDQINPNGSQSNCPFCQTSFKLLPSDSLGHQSVVFDSVVPKGKIRTCINCAREFESTDDEVIPVCPTCRTEEKRSEVAKARPKWRIESGGRTFEVETEGILRDWIRQGLVLPEDQIVTPDGKRYSAGRLKGFRRMSTFTAQRRASIPSMTWSRRVFRRSLVSPMGLSQLLRVILTVPLVGWTLYRIATYRLPPKAADITISRLVQQLAGRVTPPKQSVEALVDLSRQALARDRPEEYEAARKYLEQALFVDRSSSEVVGLLAIVYAYTAGYGDDPRSALTAIELGNLAISLYPDRPEGYIAKARAALAADNFAAAAENRERALEVAPQDMLALLTHAAVQLKTAATPEDLAQVLTTATATVRLNRNLLEAYDLIGTAHMLRGEPDQAMRAFEQRLRQESDDHRSLYSLGILEERAMNTVTAKEWYQRALRSGPNAVPARLALARIYTRLDRDVGLAERHLRDILTRYRRFARLEDIFGAQQELIHLLVKQKRLSEGEEISAQIPVLLQGSCETAIVKARLLEARLEASEALAVLGDCVRNHPTHVLGKTWHARMLAKHGSVEEAVRAHRAAIEQSPSRLSPYFHLIRYFLDHDRTDEALDVANAAVTRAGLIPSTDQRIPLAERESHPPWRELRSGFQSLAGAKDLAVAHGLVGLVELERGLQDINPAGFRSALAAFQRSANLAPSAEHTSVYLGRAHLYLRNYEEALRHFRQALKINPLSSMTQFWLGSAFRHLRLWEQSQRALEAAREDSVWGPRAIAELGELAHARKDDASAVALWRESLTRDPDYIPPWRSLLALAHRQ